MYYIDFHTHILPGIDDGAKNPQMSLEMLKELSKEGVGVVFATPHCLLSGENEETFIARRNSAYENLMSYIKTQNVDFDIPEIRLGAEIRVSANRMQINDMNSLMLQGVGAALFELPMMSYKMSLSENIYDISLQFDIVPIIAHVERYMNIYSDDDYDDLLAIPNVIFQVSTSAFQDKKEAAFLGKLIRNGATVVFGSDCHNLSSRPPLMESALKKMKKFCSKQKIQQAQMDELFEYHTKIVKGVLLEKD